MVFISLCILGSKSEISKHLTFFPMGYCSFVFVVVLEEDVK